MKLWNRCHSLVVFFITLLRVALLKKKDRASLERWQQKRLKKQLSFFIKHSPYIQKIAQQYGGSENFSKWPFMTKATMMEHFDQHNTQKISLKEAESLALQSEQTRQFIGKTAGKNVSVGFSSGTSGHRGLFMTTPQEEAFYVAAVLSKAIPQWWRKKERIALVLRANHNLYEKTNKGRLQFRFFDLFTPFEELSKSLQEYRPTLLVAPASVLKAFSLEESFDASCKKNIKRLFSVAEVLEADDKEIIEKSFGQRVDQIYQCTEGFLGISCSEGKLHLNEDLLLFEYEELEKTPDGRRRVNPIVTDLFRSTQPIVRYKMNDLLILNPHPCRCGRPYQVVDHIEGRFDDLLSFQGKVMFPDTLNRAMLHISSSSIENYRLIQKRGSEDLTIEIDYKKEATVHVLAVQKEIKKALEESFFRCGVPLPSLFFAPYQKGVCGSKQRRIYRER